MKLLGKLAWCCFPPSRCLKELKSSMKKTVYKQKTSTSCSLSYFISLIMWSKTESLNSALHPEVPDRHISIFICWSTVQSRSFFNRKHSTLFFPSLPFLLKQPAFVAILWSHILFQSCDSGDTGALLPHRLPVLVCWSVSVHWCTDA